MKLLAPIALIFASLYSTQAGLPIINEKISNMFDMWKSEHSKTYNSIVEHEHRFLNFISNLEKIIEHNKAFARGEFTYDVALNHMADLTQEEFKGFLTKKKDDKVRDVLPVHEHKRPLMRSENHGDNFDWRDHGAVTPVKNQGQCGSCWAFSAVGAMEGAHFLATQELVSFSEQQLLDCVDDGQCDCAHGGEMQDGFEYVIKNGGILTEDDDSYLGRQQECKYPLPAYGKQDAAEVEGEKPQYAATFSSYAEVTMNDEQALLSAVQQQPVSIAIDASAFSFQFYSHGVYDPKSCCTNCAQEDLDHGVLLIGYGTEKVKSRFHTKTTNVDYWLVKNSWGPSWGDEGMIKMVRNKESKCGVATDASYPIV